MSDAGPNAARRDWRRGLLVSVRDAAEATAVAEAGVAIVDIKEPLHGPLGRASAAVAAEAIMAVAGRAAVTLACGELADGPATIARHVADVIEQLPNGIPLPVAVKAGPSGLGERAWCAAFLQLAKSMPDRIELVAVAYADWQAALSLPPQAIITLATEAGARTVLVDTFNKAGPGLFGAVDSAEVAAWIGGAHDHGIAIAVAGKLSASDVAFALELGTDVVGVRSAACSGGRLGRIDSTRVRALGKLFSIQGGGTTTGPRGEVVT